MSNREIVVDSLSKQYSDRIVGWLVEDSGSCKPNYICLGCDAGYSQRWLGQHLFVARHYRLPALGGGHVRPRRICLAGTHSPQLNREKEPNG